MVLITGKRNELADDIGVSWLILDPQDLRTGWLHSWLARPEDVTQSDRAADIERYSANMIVATRRLDFVHLVRLGSAIDYRAQGRALDEKNCENVGRHARPAARPAHLILKPDAQGGTQERPRAAAARHCRFRVSRGTGSPSRPDRT
jgi:hypothetical protein